MSSLTDKIDLLIKGIPLHQLEKAAEEITDSYRDHEWFLSDLHAKVYAVVRMPATKAVIERVFKEVPFAKSLLDFGSGPGTASFATDIEQITFVEHNPHFRQISQALGARGVFGELEQPHDISLLSYSLGEVEKKKKLLDQLWDLSLKALVIIEPGTPEGYKTF